MLPAPVGRQTTGGWVMEKFRQKIRKYTLQADLLPFRVSVKGWYLCWSIPTEWIQRRVTMIYTPFCCTKWSPFRYNHELSNRFCLAWKISLTIIFQFQNTLNKQIPLTILESYWYDCLLWISLEIWICTELLVWRDFGFFYLYIINTRVTDSTFFHVQGMSCLPSQ